MFKKFTDLLVQKTMLVGAVMLFASFGWASAYPEARGSEPDNAELKSAQQQQKITVKGVVSDALGAVIGASVEEKGNPTNGTITDVDGNFSISVPSNATLKVSFIGYEAAEIAVNGKTTLQITLKESTSLLDEVVVVGYGTQKKVNLTGSVASVSAEKLENRAAPALSTALAGLASGVNIVQSSGAPGSESVTFRIRGTGSFNSSDPMILVDGMSATMDAVNPDDVESISYLKDAASAAIYGSRAANGIILITTKKGKREATPKVTYSNIFASEQPITDVSFMSSMPEWMEIHNKSQLQNNPAVTAFWYAQSTIDEWRAANANPNGIYTDPSTGNQVPNWLAYPNTDWAQIMFQPQFFQKHTISVSGGSQNSNYLLSVGYQDNPGTLENTAQQRYNIRANAETKIADFIKFGTQTYATKYFKEPGSTSMTYLFQAYPGIYPKYEGKYGAGEDPSMINMNNVLLSVASQGGLNETTRIFTTWYAGVDLFKGLNFEAKFNYQNTFGNNENYSQDLPRYRFRTSTETPAENIGVLDQATTYRYSYESAAYTADLTLNYNGTFGAHDIGALLGYEQYYTWNSSFTATKKGLIDWSITDITSAAEMYDIGGSAKTDYAMISYFGRLNYAYAGKYLFEANFRSDASSRFAPGHRWGLFPSFSAGWRISEESFFDSARDYIDNLKLRASWGKLGNTASGNYSWQALYSKKSNVLDQAVQNGLAQSQLPNPYLSWESVTTTDLGFDAAFLKQKLTLEFDVYSRNTSGILTSPPIYYTMGNISAPMANTADMNNKGLEFTVGWNDKKGDFRYGISLNASYNTNKVTNFKGALEWGEIAGATDVNGNPVMGWVNLSDVSTGSDTRRVEGYSLDEWFLRTPYTGTGTYTKSDGSVDPNGGPKDGMIRTKADLDWVRAMIAAGYSFNGKTVDVPNAAKTQGGRGGYLWYGEMIMADSNGDGNYGNDNDRQFLGKSTIPKWTFGSTINAEWKGIDVSMTFAGRYGSWHYINERGVNNSNVDANTTAVPWDAATRFYSYDAVKALKEFETYDPAEDPTANITGTYPRLLAQNSSTNPSNTLFLYNTSFVKLKTMQVGYTLPKSWMRSAKISRLRIFFSGENLLTFCSDKYLGVDPELGSSINVYPLARMLSGGLTLTF
ncbi:MAG: TonB-dependent receptor [Dysgonamonadaceae bacterium]|nr:TonB-dependent receptor [Dysgonamonadaceae bacterium]